MNRKKSKEIQIGSAHEGTILYKANLPALLEFMSKIMKLGFFSVFPSVKTFHSIVFPS